MQIAPFLLSLCAVLSIAAGQKNKNSQSKNTRAVSKPLPRATPLSKSKGTKPKPQIKPAADPFLPTGPSSSFKEVPVDSVEPPPAQTFEVPPLGAPLKKPVVVVTPVPNRTQRAGVAMTIHALQLSKVEPTGLAPGFILQNPNDEIIPSFRIEDVSRFRLSYDYGFSKVTVGAEFLYFTGAPNDLSWSEIRAHAYFNPSKNLVGFFIGPSMGMGTLRMDSKSVGSSLYAGADVGFKIEIKRGVDAGAALDVGYMSTDYTRGGLATKARWNELSLRLLLGFAF